VVVSLERIHAAAQEGAWQAAAWILERRYPHEYGRTVQEHVEKVDWERLTDEQVKRLAAGEPLRKVLQG
jgi:hypothetical protein